MMRGSALLVAVMVLTACNETSVSEQRVQATEEICGSGGTVVQVLENRSFCVYQYPIVIETGFRCPIVKPDLFIEEPRFGACTDFGDLNDIEIQFTLDRYGDFETTSSTEPWLTGPKSVDVLFVLDNSGSMCQEQTKLVDGFDAFLAPIAESDFQIGITTTHLNTDYPPELVARPGQLQSTPQPQPGFDQSCILDVDSNGAPIDRSYAQLKSRLVWMAECMQVPDPRYAELTNAEMDCIFGSSGNCSVPSFGCSNAGCAFENLVPSAEEFREIPKVLRSADYRTAGALDREALAADFRCAAMVGTRGYGFEKGLGAAVLAVSPELTGGAVELDDVDKDPSAPNHGLIRRGAKTALIFVADENDCTHDGSIDEGSTCGDAVCEYARLEGGLMDVQDLKGDFVANLAATKQREVTASEIIVGSFHGTASPFSGEPQTTCSPGADRGVETTCQNENGIAFSGDRYQSFMRSFEGSSQFPQQDLGLTCAEGDWSGALEQLGETIHAQIN